MLIFRRFKLQKLTIFIFGQLNGKDENKEKRDWTWSNLLKNYQNFGISLKPMS